MYDVCIIGGGQSGLTTCKTFSDKNIICLERSYDSIGMFSTIKEKDYFTWSTSRYMSGFSDFPISKDIPVWFTIQHYLDYLTSYMKHFDLEKFIKYNSNVINCFQNKNKEWVVTYQYFNSITELTCKKLIVCSGLNQHPKYPDLDTFTGEIIHTDDVYKMDRFEWNSKFSNKRILIMGGGESAFDIGDLITKYASKTYFTTKEYIEWFFKGDESNENKKRINKIDDKCLNNLKPFFDNYDNPTDTGLSYIEYNLPEPISFLFHEYSRKILFQMYNDFNCNKCIHQIKDLCKINKTPDSLFNKYVVKRTEFLLDIYEKKVKVVYYPTNITNNTIYTKDDIFDVDIIICSTGYKKYFPFLKESVYKDTYIKKMIPQNTDNIAFIGFARPTMSSIALIAEMQSWWVKLYFENTLQYKIRSTYFRYNDPLDLSNNNINTLVIGCYYIKDLAKDLKIEPHMLYLLFTDFELFNKILFGSCHPMIYRIHGNKSYTNAREVLINTLPVKDSHFVNMYKKVFFSLLHFIYLIFILCVTYIITKWIPYRKIWFIVIFILLIYLSYFI